MVVQEEGSNIMKTKDLEPVNFDIEFRCLGAIHIWRPHAACRGRVVKYCAKKLAFFGIEFRLWME